MILISLLVQHIGNNDDDDDDDDDDNISILNPDPNFNNFLRPRLKKPDVSSSLLSMNNNNYYNKSKKKKNDDDKIEM